MYCLHKLLGFGSLRALRFVFLIQAAANGTRPLLPQHSETETNTTSSQHKARVLSTYALKTFYL